MPAHRLWMKSGAAGREIDVSHTAIYDDEDHDMEGNHGKLYQEGL